MENHYGQRRLVGYDPQGRKESDMTSVLASTKLQVDLSAHLFESSIDFTLCSVFLR